MKNDRELLNLRLTVTFRGRIQIFPGSAKIQDPGLPVPIDHDIIGADISVDQTILMEHMQKPHEGAQDPVRFRKGNRPVSAHKFMQSNTVYIDHDHIGCIIGGKMLQNSCCFRRRGISGLYDCFFFKSIQFRVIACFAVCRYSDGIIPGMPAAGKPFGIELLDRYLALQIYIPAQIGDPKTAFPQHPSNQIAVLPVPQYGSGRQLVIPVHQSRRPAAAPAYRTLHGFHAVKTASGFHLLSTIRFGGSIFFYTEFFQTIIEIFRTKIIFPHDATSNSFFGIVFPESVCSEPYTIPIIIIRYLLM